MNITQIADELYREVSDDENQSISKIAFWFRSALGIVNNLLATSFEINSSLEYTPELTADEAAILKECWWIYYWNDKFRKSLGASGVEIVEVREGDSVVRRTARTEFGKLYLQNKKMHQDALKELVFLYKQNRSTAYSIDVVESTILPPPCDC